MGPLLLLGAQTLAPQTVPQDPSAILLAQMEDVVAPEDIGMWPLALGWWLALILTTLLIGASVRYLVKKIKSQRYRKAALSALDTLTDSSRDNASRCEYIMQILKRTFFTAYPGSRGHIAGFYGSQWMQLLENTSTQPLGLGDVMETIDTALYHTKANTIQSEELLHIAKLWVRNHRPMSEQVWKEIVATDNNTGAHHV